MAFTGQTFIFDGVSSEEFGLMLCDFDNAQQEAGKIGAELSIQEDRIARRATGLHYGVLNNSPKIFPIVMVAQNPTQRFDRYDVARVATWLSGHADYKKLVILEPGMENVYYRCIITDIEQIEVGLRVIGFTATVKCDSPYAYQWVKPTTLSVTDSVEMVYKNLSNVNDYYRPTIEITCTSTDFSITNTTDGTSFVLSDMPATEKKIYVDALNQVITCSDGTDLYGCWNVGLEKHFPRFVRGDNKLSITGTGSLSIQNVFPWNIGN